MNATIVIDVNGQDTKFTVTALTIRDQAIHIVVERMVWPDDPQLVIPAGDHPVTLYDEERRVAGRWIQPCPEPAEIPPGQNTTGVLLTLDMPFRPILPSE